MKFQFEIAWTWTEVINASSQLFQLQINGCVIYHSTRQCSYFQNNLVIKRKYGAVFQKSRSKVKKHFSHKNLLNTKFQLESLFH
jgi:hypothetical protein